MSEGGLSLSLEAEERVSGNEEGEQKWAQVCFEGFIQYNIMAPSVSILE